MSSERVGRNKSQEPCKPTATAAQPHRKTSYKCASTCYLCTRSSPRSVREREACQPAPEACAVWLGTSLGGQVVPTNLLTTTDVTLKQSGLGESRRRDEIRGTTQTHLVCLALRYMMEAPRTRWMCRRRWSDGFKKGAASRRRETTSALASERQ